MNIIKKILNIISELIYYLILVPLLFITLSVVIQSVTEKDKIPDIFGYKMFMVLDEKMDKNIDYGDLVFTKNVDTQNLKIGDLVAYRKKDNIVIIHKIINIENSNNGNKIFEMQVNEGEMEDAKKANEYQIEGIFANKIPNVGTVIMFIQEPINLLKINLAILAVGIIAYYFAKKIDEKQEKK